MPPVIIAVAVIAVAAAVASAAAQAKAAKVASENEQKAADRAALNNQMQSDYGQAVTAEQKKAVQAQAAVDRADMEVTMSASGVTIGEGSTLAALMSSRQNEQQKLAELQTNADMQSAALKSSSDMGLWKASADAEVRKADSKNAWVQAGLKSASSVASIARPFMSPYVILMSPYRSILQIDRLSRSPLSCTFLKCVFFFENRVGGRWRLARYSL